MDIETAQHVVTAVTVAVDALASLVVVESFDQWIGASDGVARMCCCTVADS